MLEGCQLSSPELVCLGTPWWRICSVSYILSTDGKLSLLEGQSIFERIVHKESYICSELQLLIQLHACQDDHTLIPVVDGWCDTLEELGYALWSIPSPYSASNSAVGSLWNAGLSTASMWKPCKRCIRLLAGTTSFPWCYTVSTRIWLPTWV